MAKWLENMESLLQTAFVLVLFVFIWALIVYVFVYIVIPLFASPYISFLEKEFLFVILFYIFKGAFKTNG